MIKSPWAKGMATKAMAQIFDQEVSHECISKILQIEPVLL
jgi:hypothetical protein